MSPTRTRRKRRRRLESLEQRYLLTAGTVTFVEEAGTPNTCGTGFVDGTCHTEIDDASLEILWGNANSSDTRLRVTNTSSARFVTLFGVRDLFTVIPEPGSDHELSINAATLTITTGSNEAAGRTLNVSRVTTPWLSGAPGTSEARVRGTSPNASTSAVWTRGTQANGSTGTRFHPHKDTDHVRSVTHTWQGGWIVENNLDVTSLVRDMYSAGENDGFALYFDSSDSSHHMTGGRSSDAGEWRPRLTVSYEYTDVGGQGDDGSGGGNDGGSSSEQDRAERLERAEQIVLGDGIPTASAANHQSFEEFIDDLVNNINDRSDNHGAYTSQYAVEAFTDLWLHGEGEVSDDALQKAIWYVNRLRRGMSPRRGGVVTRVDQRGGNGVRPESARGASLSRYYGFGDNNDNVLDEMQLATGLQRLFWHMLHSDRTSESQKRWARSRANFFGHHIVEKYATSYGLNNGDMNRLVDRAATGHNPRSPVSDPPRGDFDEDDSDGLRHHRRDGSSSDGHWNDKIFVSALAHAQWDRDLSTDLRGTAEDLLRRLDANERSLAVAKRPVQSA